MKIIFLDIDGVLNRWSGIDRRDFIPECVDRLNAITNATGAKLVISSAWRGLINAGHMDAFGFGRMLRTHGVHAEVVGATRRAESDEPRWRQIADWLRGPTTPIESYCILDDDSDAFGGRPGVLVAGSLGLTTADVAQAIEILGPK